MPKELISLYKMLKHIVRNTLLRLLLLSVLILHLSVTISRAQWVKTNGPIGGSVNTIVVKGTDLFAGTWLGGIFRSSDNGNIWIPVNNGLTDTNVHTLILKGSNLFAGTVTGVFRSQDNGNTWAKCNNGLSDTNVLSLAGRGNNLFAGTVTGGVFRTSDNGESWVPVNNGMNDSTCFSLVEIDTIIFAGTNKNGVFRSLDNGESWTTANNGLDFGSSPVSSFAVSGKYLYAGVVSFGVFRSSNNGDEWTKVDNGLTSRGVLSLAAMGADLYDGTWGDGVFHSKDYGGSWALANIGFPAQTNVRSLVVSGGTLFAGTDDDFTGSYNGGVWKRPLSEMTATITKQTGSSAEFGFEIKSEGLIVPNTIVHFTILQKSLVELSMYNSAGNKVATLFRGNLPPGNHQETIIENGFAMGIYFLRLQSNGLSSTKSIVLER